jgi:hypothetical protein
MVALLVFSSARSATKIPPLKQISNKSPSEKETNLQNKMKPKALPKAVKTHLPNKTNETKAYE